MTLCANEPDARGLTKWWYLSTLLPQAMNITSTDADDTATISTDGTTDADLAAVNTSTTSKKKRKRKKKAKGGEAALAPAPPGTDPAAGAAVVVAGGNDKYDVQMDPATGRFAVAKSDLEPGLMVLQVLAPTLHSHAHKHKEGPTSDCGPE